MVEKVCLEAEDAASWRASHKDARIENHGTGDGLICREERHHRRPVPLFPRVGYSRMFMSDSKFNAPNATLSNCRSNVTPQQPRRILFQNQRTNLVTDANLFEIG